MRDMRLVLILLIFTLFLRCSCDSSFISSSNSRFAACSQPFPWFNSSLPLSARLSALIGNMTLEEKIAQLVMALHMDKGNAALEAFGKQLDEAIAARVEGDKKNWRK